MGPEKAYIIGLPAVDPIRDDVVFADGSVFLVGRNGWTCPDSSPRFTHDHSDDCTKRSRGISGRPHGASNDLDKKL